MIEVVKMIALGLAIYYGFMVGVQCQLDTWVRGLNSMALNGKYQLKTGVNAVETCSFECSSQLGCRHFFFDFTTKKCYLHSKFFTSQSLTSLDASRYDPPGIGECPAMFKLTEDGICFYVMNDNRYKGNFDHARGACQVYGGDLMVIDSQRKHDVLLKYLVDDRHYLFGIYNITSDGQFQTVDGRSDGDFMYRNWQDLYPNDEDGASDGVLRTFDSATEFHWRNAIDLTRYYICEF